MNDLLDYAKDIEENPDSGVTPDEMYDVITNGSQTGEIAKGIPYDPSQDPEYIAEALEARRKRLAK